jgi:CBS-domain-containing membrane protein
VDPAPIDTSAQAPSVKGPTGARDVGRILYAGLGAALAISLALSLAGPWRSPLLLGSLGASSVFLFSLTRAPAAQPRTLFGGHLGAAFIGIACYQALGDALWVDALALTLALVYMLLANTLHPPAGANPLIMIYAHASWAALLQPVLLGVLSLAVVAVVWSRLAPGLARYPLARWQPSPLDDDWSGWKD